MNTIWQLYPYLISFFIFFDILFESAECAGTEGSSSGAGNSTPEPDENTLYWQRFREFLKNNHLHIPRPHTIKDLREEVCGKQANNLKFADILSKFYDRNEFKMKIFSTL